MFQSKSGKQATRPRGRRTESHRGRQLRAKLTTAMDREREVRRKWKAVGSELDERARRRWAGAEARALGAGAVSLVARATGLNRRTVRKGISELGESGPGAGRVRRIGGGRKAHAATQPDMVSVLDSLVEPTTRGDPMSPLRWTIKSTRILAAELEDRGFAVSHSTVGRMLREMGYSLQSTRKTREGTDHPDRDAQFRRISKLAADYQKRGQPVVSVDTKKKELVGDFANRGQEWQPKGKPVEVRTHDFPDEELGKAIPYGVYDIARNRGFVNVGVTHDTPEFAVATLRRWWQDVGRHAYPEATELLATADCGGSNGYRPRLWKLELQRMADDTGLNIRVAHFPPGTSKWNKIEHRMFCHITHNWRGKPLTSVDVIVSMIGATKTGEGLRIKARLDRREFAKGRKVTDEQMAELALILDKFHGDWNYTLKARPPSN